ncbi:unnamed protein product [Protopolystoma xenopodis]|uniref:Uncharacterized protein n=1 Tax=Protopolystoma xenopodis TaxID=117903 RepID=A0A3S4ZXY3_9PLAT|nr:unnamed protein product [Protopolystoma xenopodis]
MLLRFWAAKMNELADEHIFYSACLALSTVQGERWLIFRVRLANGPVKSVSLHCLPLHCLTRKVCAGPRLSAASMLDYPHLGCSVAVLRRKSGQLTGHNLLGGK